MLNHKVSSLSTSESTSVPSLSMTNQIGTFPVEPKDKSIDLVFGCLIVQKWLGNFNARKLCQRLPVYVMENPDSLKPRHQHKKNDEIIVSVEWPSGEILTRHLALPTTLLVKNLQAFIFPLLPKNPRYRASLLHVFHDHGGVDLSTLRDCDLKCCDLVKPRDVLVIWPGSFYYTNTHVLALITGYHATNLFY